MPAWCIVDANIFLDAVRYEIGPGGSPLRDPAYAIVAAYKANRFVWVYSQDILDEYVRQFHILRRNVQTGADRRHFDTQLYNATITAIKQGPGLVVPSEEQLDRAYAVIMDERRPEHLRDEDDIIYLAAAEEAKAQGADIQVLVGSNDSDLYTLRSYQGIPIHPAPDFLHALNRP